MDELNDIDFGSVGTQSLTPEQKKSLTTKKPRVNTQGNKPSAKKKVNVPSHVKFGDGDDLPNQMIAMVERSSIMPGLSEFWEGVLFGDGLRLYQKTTVNGKRKIVEFEDAEVEEWLEDSRAEEALIEVLPDYFATGNGFIQLLWNKGGKIYLFKHNEVTECRVSPFDNQGLSKYVVVDPHFSQYVTSDTINISEEVPAVERIEVPNLITNKEAAEKEKRGIIHIKRKKAGKRYYGLPVWWSEETLKALNISYEIFTFKEKNLKNSLNIKYHIKVWKNFFKDKFGHQTDEEELKKKKRDFVKQIHENLTKPENAGKAFWSEFVYDQSTKQPLSGIIIDKIDSNLNDDAYSKSIDQITAILAMATNTNPGLADLIVAGKLGGDTGSAVRESYNVTGKTKTKISRKLLLAPINWALKYNFPELKNVFVDFASFELTTTDQSKTGVKESNPTVNQDATATQQG
ncbi:hypothetical protein [Flammeovirga aprica]|uniref:Phage portal protein n=1 Tax=Flammeovirga aprica JL-4 TaxID=694437 RepID=A0A7X9P0B6_9BACT|nr:hypothetical protein [Flammeovirga aprica]NME67209.1 hypothetical protein [Flammeovirga aprica JL-4]